MLAVERQILAIEQRQRTWARSPAPISPHSKWWWPRPRPRCRPSKCARRRDLLTALAGKLPADEIPETFALASLTLPADLPVSLPAKLVEQRPDIQIAQANLHSASAEIGVAIANMLPNITLTAQEGTVGTEMSQLLGSGSNFWSLGAGLTQPIFDGGTLLHRTRAARETSPRWRRNTAPP